MCGEAVGEAGAAVSGRTEGRVVDPGFNVAENAGGGFTTFDAFFFFFNGRGARMFGESGSYTC